MEIIIEKNQASASQCAARHVANLVLEKPDAVIGLASGESPKRLYDILISMENAGQISFKRCTFFSLDEYLGLDVKDPHSYRYYYEENFFGKLKVRPEKIYTPDGKTENVPAFCSWYEEMIVSSGGIDLQLLGIGVDGHLAFNEPGSSLSGRTRIKTLASSTVRANQKHFKKSAVPRHVLTMGLGNILEARTCLLLAFGQKKAKAVAQMAEGPVSAMVPASVLQLHKRAKICLDRAAAQKLKLRSYYESVYANKPSWQRI